MELEIKINQIKKELDALKTNAEKRNKFFELGQTGGKITYLQPSVTHQGDTHSQMRFYMEHNDVFYSFLLSIHHKKDPEKSLKKALKKIAKKGFAFLEKEADEIHIDYVDVKHPDDVIDAYKVGLETLAEEKGWC